MVEQGPLKPKVEGSIPSWLNVFFFHLLRIIFHIYFCLLLADRACLLRTPPLLGLSLQEYYLNTQYAIRTTRYAIRFSWLISNLSFYHIRFFPYLFNIYFCILLEDRAGLLRIPPLSGLSLQDYYLNTQYE